MRVVLLLPNGSSEAFEDVDNIGFLDRSHTIRSTGERTLIVNPEHVVAVTTDEELTPEGVRWMAE